MTILSSNALIPYLKRTGRRRALSIRTPKGYELRVSTSSEDSFAPDPLPNSIGNFFDNTTETLSFIQCYMLNLVNIEGHQYGVGFPVDMPVMLGYFENNEFRAVEKNHNDYDHLINHVTVQMDSNDFQLYTTPVVLTLQGELEDDEVEEEDEYDGEDYDDEEEEEFSLEELLAQEDEYDEDECDEDDEHDEEDDVERSAADNEEAAFMNESPIGKIDPKYSSQPDLSIYSPKEGVIQQLIYQLMLLLQLRILRACAKRIDVRTG